MRKLLSIILGLMVGGASAQIPISNLPNANLPLTGAEQTIVNQVGVTKKTTVSSFGGLFPPLTATYLLQSPNAGVPNSRTLVGTANEILLADGGPLGNLVLSTPQPIATASTPTFAGMTLTGLLSGTSATFSGALSSAGYTGTTGIFSGALSAASLSLTAPLPVTSGGTGLGTLPIHTVLLGEGTGNVGNVAAMAVDTFLQGQGAAVDPAAGTLPSCSAATQALTYNTGTHVFGCQTVAGGVTGLANPSGLIGLTAVNGVATTADRSDSTHALSQAIVPTWTGVHTFSATPVFSAGITVGGASFTGLANPTGTVGLTAVNGTATTAPRSDSAPVLSQAITPTWTNLHTFNAGLTSVATAKGTSTGGGTTPSFLASAAVPAFEWQTPGNAADQKDVQCYYNGAALQFNCTFVNDAGSAEKIFLQATRGATTTVSAINIGNATDNPAITINGNVTIPAPGAGVTLKVTSPATSTAAIQGTCVSGTFSATTNPCISLVNTNASAQTPIDFFSNTATMTGRLRNDSAGNMTYVSFVSGNHSFFTGGDSGVGTLRMAVGPGTAVTFPTVGTTASAANAFLDNAASNNLLRSTSSLRYKQDISTMTADAASAIYKLRPVRFHSKASADSRTAWFYGLVAEEVATVEPSLIVRDAEGRPDGVQYDRLQVFMLPEVQKLRRDVTSLQIQVYLMWAFMAGLLAFMVWSKREES